MLRSIIAKQNVFKMFALDILKAISQPRTLSADIPASERGVYLFYNPLINFQIAIKPLASGDLMANARD